MMEHGILSVRDFDLEATLNSGQVFHWRRSDDGFSGMIGATPVFVRQPAPDTIEFHGPHAGPIQHYFSLDHDIEVIKSSFPADDGILADAVAFAPGLRIIRQPLWECLATFITSSLKQVAHITEISHTLRRKFGVAIGFGGGTLHAYPDAETLAAAGEAGLRECGLGYRAAFLARTAEAVASGALDLDGLRDTGLSDPERLAALRAAPGVGPKIASCVMLFGLGRLGAFPIDVWVERVLRDLYAEQTSGLSRAALHEFIESHFGPNRGYAQQFLFHKARMTMPRHSRFEAPRRRRSHH
jgi:N-glycosylase/DNA lyase